MHYQACIRIVTLIFNYGQYIVYILSRQVCILFVMNDMDYHSESDDESSILFSCRCPERPSVDIHTHGHAQNIVWNLGSGIVTGKDDAKHLEGPAKAFWREFNRKSMKDALKETDPVPKLKIPGGKVMIKK